MLYPYFVTPRRSIAFFSRAPVAWLLIALSGLVSQARAAPAALTLESATQLAVLRSRQLQAQDYAATAARDLAVAARQLPDPVLKFGVENVPTSGPDRYSLTGDFMTMRRIGIMQELTSSKKRELRASGFEQEAQKALAQKDLEHANIERDVALAWLDRFYAEAMVAVLTEQKIQAQMEIEAASAAYRSARASQADVISARSALASYEDRAAELRQRLLSATILLARWIGEGEDLALAGKPAMDFIPLVLTTLETQLASHPQMALLAKQESIARTQAQLASADKAPDWSVEFAFQQRGPSYSNMVSVGLSVPLQWDRGRRQDRALAASNAQVEQAKAERDEALRSHIADTRMLITQWESMRARGERFSREILPLAIDRTTASLSAYRGGKASLAEVLASRRNEIDMRLQALQIDADTARLWAQLTFMVPQAAATGGKGRTAMENAR